MLHHTLGLAISFRKYRETSIITRIYTSKFGMQTYLVNGVRASKTKMGLGLFSPLTQLQLVVYHKNQADALQRISEIHIEYPYQKIGINFHYTAIAMFLTELLDKCLSNEEPDLELFTFVQQSFQLLDALDEARQLFAIRFLFHFTSFMGFGIQTAEHLYYAINVDSVRSIYPITQEEKTQLQAVIETPFTTLIQVPIALRRAMLQHLLDFYALHLPNFSVLRSLSIIQESMS